MPKLNSSCDPNVEHIIANCNEVAHLAEDVYLKFVYVEKDGYEGSLVGLTACEKDGTPIEGGLVIVEKDGVWVRQKIEGPNLDRLSSVFELDNAGKVKVVQ